jgi:hypothetical protein
MARGRRPKAQETFPLQMTFRLSQELRDQLGKAAGDRAVGDEIRERLEASFSDAGPTPGDDKTAKFLQQTAQLAAIVSQHFGAWHEDPRAFAIFKYALTELGLRDFDPEPRDEHGNFKLPAAAPSEDIDKAAFMAAATAGFVSVW